MTQPDVDDMDPISWHGEAVHRLSVALFHHGQVATSRAVTALSEKRRALEVTLHADVDLTDKPALDALIQRFRASGDGSVEVDLRGVTSFGPTPCLSFLAGLRRIARQRVGTLTLAGPCGTCLR